MHLNRRPHKFKFYKAWQQKKIQCTTTCADTSVIPFRNETPSYLIAFNAATKNRILKIYYNWYCLKQNFSVGVTCLTTIYWLMPRWIELN